MTDHCQSINESSAGKITDIEQGLTVTCSGGCLKHDFYLLKSQFPCILIENGQPTYELRLSNGQMSLDLTSGQPLMLSPALSLKSFLVIKDCD